jgi:type IV pilus assembly protein PilO
MALMPKNQRDQAMVLVTVVAVALIGLFWVYVYSPKSVELATLQARVDTLEVRNDKAKAELAKGKVDVLKAEAEQFQRDLEVMRQLVPTGNEVPSLLEQVSTAARRVGLDISTVEPQPVIEGDQFDTYRYKLAVTGGYHALGQFLSNVGSLTRIVAPVNLALAPRANVTKSKDVIGSALDAKFEVQTYVTKTARPSKGGKS